MPVFIPTAGSNLASSHRRTLGVESGVEQLLAFGNLRGKRELMSNTEKERGERCVSPNLREPIVGFGVAPRVKINWSGACQEFAQFISRSTAHGHDDLFNPATAPTDRPSLRRLVANRVPWRHYTAAK